jgi:hypothetical protein
MTWAWQRGRLGWTKWNDTGDTFRLQEGDAVGDWRCEHWVRLVFGLWWRIA